MTAPRVLCRHCRTRHVNRPLGLCWHCYYAPGVRAQYPSTSPYANRTGNAPLNAEPSGDGAVALADEGAWYVVGRADDGTRTILSGHGSAESATAQAHRLVAGGIDYAEVTVEQHLQPPVLRLTPAPDRTDPMNHTPWQRLCGAAQPEKEPIVPETPTPVPAANGHAAPLNNHERGAAIKAIVAELGAAASRADVNARLEADGLGACGDSTWKHWRAVLFGGTPKQRPGPLPGTPKPAQPAHVVTPAPTAVALATAPDYALDLVRLDRLCRRLGGVARVRELLHLLEE